MNTNSNQPLLLDEMRSILRREGYAYSTENSYCDWVRRFVKFHGITSRADMLVDSSIKVEKFLTHLAVHQNVAPSTQNQALNAIIFLYEDVFCFDFSVFVVFKKRRLGVIGFGKGS